MVLIRFFTRVALTIAAAGSVTVAWAATRDEEGSPIHVSLAGDDANPGSSAKPVAHLSRALELARALPRGVPRRVVLTAGDYFDVGVTLTQSDSNLTMESAPGGRAKLVGGVRLSGWEPQGDRFWSVPLPPGRSWDVRMLQVNGRFCPRARFPATGTLTHRSVFDVPWMSTTGGGWKRKPTALELTTLQYRKGDIPATLDIDSAEVTVFHMWDESVAGIRTHDPTKAILTLSPPLGHPPGAFGVKTYCLWNVKEGMTRPGQWYYDRARGRIVYWPLPGEDMRQAVGIVPTVRSVVKIAGASNVTLRDLDVQMTTVPLITGGFAAGSFDGAVQLDRSDGAVLSGLRISHVAGHAIKARGHQAAVRVEGCDVSNCGAGGVYISGANSVVRETLIHDVGLMFPSAMGINGNGKSVNLSHNEIHDTPYSAIGFGGEDVVIEHNLISRCMKVLHDGAAVYCFGSKRARVRNNVARDITDTGGYGASAYYLDEQCEGCVVERNISLNVARPSHNHMARNNVIRDNVFISSGDMTMTFPRCHGYTVRGNVLYAGGAVTFEGVDAVTAWSDNLVFTASGRVTQVVLKEYTPASRRNGPPGDTRTADPLFVDLPHLDLQYRPGSPARELGLAPLDVSQAGRQR